MEMHIAYFVSQDFETKCESITNYKMLFTILCLAIARNSIHNFFTNINPILILPLFILSRGKISTVKHLHALKK